MNSARCSVLTHLLLARIYLHILRFPSPHYNGISTVSNLYSILELNKCFTSIGIVQRNINCLISFFDSFSHRIWKVSDFVLEFAKLFYIEMLKKLFCRCSEYLVIICLDNSLLEQCRRSEVQITAGTCLYQVLWLRMERTLDKIIHSMFCST